MKIRLDLQKHCIETEIKRIYNQCVSQFFNSESDTNLLEKQISILQYALEQFDYPRLRGKYVELAGNSTAEIFLCMNQNNQIGLLINGQNIESF